MKILNSKILFKILPVILLFFVSITLSGQNGNSQSLKPSGVSGDGDIASLIARQTAYLRKIYSEKVEVPKELINGKEYEPYYLRSEFKPLLFPLRERTATIITGNRRYNNVTLQYDTFQDEVLYTDTSRTINFRFPQIALNKDILVGFNLHFKEESLKFINFKLPECAEKKLSPGFYESVYEGKSTYLIRHESSFYERQGVNNYKYSPKNYISTGGSFYKVKTANDLLDLFGDKSGRMKEYIHSAGIKFKKASKDEIASILKYYDSLEKSE